MIEKLQQQFNFLIEIDKMKNIFRQNLIADKSRRENDAEHSWHFALMAMVLYEYADTAQVDLLRVLKMALVHDLVEIYAGDTFAYDETGYESKLARELAAADKIFGMLPTEQGAELRALWMEFDAMETPDARFAATIDRLQPLMLNCKTEGQLGGGPWARSETTSEKVIARASVGKDAAPQLWELSVELINDAIAQGFLRA